MNISNENYLCRLLDHGQQTISSIIQSSSTVSVHIIGIESLFNIYKLSPNDKLIVNIKAATDKDVNNYNYSNLSYNHIINNGITLFYKSKLPGSEENVITDTSSKKIDDKTFINNKLVKQRYALET